MNWYAVRKRWLLVYGRLIIINLSITVEISILRNIYYLVFKWSQYDKLYYIMIKFKYMFYSWYSYMLLTEILLFLLCI